MWLAFGCELREKGDELICCAAASSYYIDPTLVDELLHFVAHLLGCLVVLSHGVGESCVGVDGDVVW